MPSFFTGWLTSELPLHAIGWQALASVSSPVVAPADPGRMGGHGPQRRLVDHAAAHLEGGDDPGPHPRRRVPGDAFGDDLDIGTSPLAPSGAPPVVDRRRIAAGPLTPWKKRYVHGPSLRYGDAGRRNQLDIWRRPDLPKDGKAPVLVQVHGGAWVIGNKDQQAMPLMAHLADRGWICVSINYRLSPRATWPDHIVDVKRALAWVKDHIADYGGDPDFVAITGGSAGGHPCSLAALTPNEPEFQPDSRRRTLRGRRGADLRRLRLPQPRRHRPRRHDPDARRPSSSSARRGARLTGAGRRR